MKEKYKGKVVSRVYMNEEETKYVVTKKGDIYNTKTGKKLKHKIDRKGYPKVTISHNGIAKDKRVHVLVALGFVKNPNPEKFKIVNHLDGNKLNPYYKNLEWTDHKGNMKHAIKHGLLKPLSGENTGRAKLKNKDVHEICKYLSEGKLTQREISKKFNVDESIIHEIKLGNNWKEISSQYDFTNCKLGIVTLKESDVHNVCQEIEKNELKLKEIAKKCDVTYDAVLRILNKKCFKKISDGYDFSKYDKRTSYSKSTLNKIVELISEGKTNKEIIKILDLPKGEKTNTLLYRKRKELNL